jgi:hypothetical protein
MIEPEIAFADLSDNAALAEALLKYTFAALLNERQEDLAFFDQRIEKRLVAKLEGIVGSELEHIDYGEAIQALKWANEKFEFPVEWGIDREHYSPPFPPPRAGEGRVADLRRYGTVARRLRPRPGFRRGHPPNVTGLANVRDAIPFPRTPATRGIEARYFSARVSMERQGRDLARSVNRADRGGITHRGGAIFP